MYILEFSPPHPFFSPFPVGNIIVYGNTIDVYTTVETLLSLGINGSRIHLVQPPLGSSLTCLNNREIESAIQEALSEAGVAVYGDSILAEWSSGEDPSLITQAAFTTPAKPFQLQCSVSVYSLCTSFCLLLQTKSIKSRCSPHWCVPFLIVS